VQVIGMVEERLSLSEDRMAALEARVAGALDERLAVSEARVGALVARLEAQARPREHPRWTEESVDGDGVAGDRGDADVQQPAAEVVAGEA
jgi:hypothetical protein